MRNWVNEIDEAAQEMMRGEPDAGLNARVLARIDTADAPGCTRRSLWTWSPVALAAAALLAVSIARAPWTADRSGPHKVRPTPGNGTEVRAADSSEGRSADSRQPPAGAPAAPADPAAAPVGRVFSDPAQVSVEFVVARASDMESIAPAPLEIEPLRIDDVETMESIQMTRIDVAPLDVPLLSAQQ